MKVVTVKIKSINSLLKYCLENLVKQFDDHTKA